MSVKTDYITAIPIPNALSTPETRDEYLRQLKLCGTGRVFIFPRNSFADDEYRAEVIEKLGENIRFYQKNGLEVGVWFGGFGHGGGLFRNERDRRDTESLTRITDLATGVKSGDSFCPLDKSFQKTYFSYIKAAAKLSPDLIMIDDDFRMGLHGSANVGCACELHMREYCRRLGRNITREELAPLVFSGEPNKYRELWLSVNGDGLKSFAAGLRKTVDEVNPQIRLGHCACYPTWDVDGTDNIELARIFAGSTKPFLRFIGAPYWFSLFGNIKSLGNVVELERMQQKWCETLAPDIEIFSEGDVYPRPRYVIPSSYVEGFDQTLRASGGMDGILKYIFSYDSEPGYETGYIERHVKNMPLLDKISNAFRDGRGVGLHIFERMRKIADHDFGTSPDVGVMNSFFPASQNLTCAVSVPTTYDDTDDGYPAVIFGDNAKHLGGCYKTLPLILDVQAALILKGEGVDTGVESCSQTAAPTREIFGRYGYGVSLSGGGSYYDVKMKPGAEPLSDFASEDGTHPAAYLYENSDGRRFMIYCFDAYGISASDALFKSYGRQAQLIDAVAWLAKGRRLQAVLRKNPGAYIICKSGRDSLTVGIWNFWPDPATDPVIELDREYDKITFISGEGRLDGRFVKLDRDIAPFGFAGFTVI